MSGVNGAALPRGWTRVALSRIAEINPGLSESAIEDTVVPMRAVEEEGRGLLRPEVRPFGEVKKGYTRFRAGDVISAKITPCMENGKTTVVPQLPGSVCFGSTEFHVIRPEPRIDARWIANFLLQHEVRRAAQRQMTGGVGQMRVPAGFLESLEIPVAPSPEQQRVADAIDELLSDLDAAVDTIRGIQTALAPFRASVLKAAVEGTLTAGWRQQHRAGEPASALLARILVERRRRWEEDQLGKFAAAGKAPPKNWKPKYKEPVPAETATRPALPEGWCWATMDQLAWASGYGTSQKCRETNAGLPVLRIPNIIGGGVELADLKFAPPGYHEDERELVHVGDLLVVRTNGSRTLIGRGAVVRDGPGRPLSFASYLIRLRIAPLPNLLKWLAVLWESPYVRRWVEARAATSAGQFNISLGVLATLPVPLPPDAEQERLADNVEDQLSVIDHLKAELEIKLQAAQGLRQSILRDAFTGQLVPQDSNDEPACELLQRIAAEREERARRAAAAKKGAAPVRGARKRKARRVP
jgi:type I restriction enzyme S subunit